jgi:hypothetical protein
MPMVASLAAISSGRNYAKLLAADAFNQPL